MICGVVLFSIIWLSSFTTGCTADTPVDGITIRQADPDRHIPSMYFGETGQAFKTDIFALFAPGDSVYIGLKVKRDLKDTVTFTRFTFYNLQTKTETELAVPEDNPAFYPGGTDLIAFNDPWLVPGDTGVYELRIYYGAQLVAAITFAVREKIGLAIEIALK